MIVYKYLSPNRASVLEDGLIRFTQSGALNDPFETTPNMRKLEQSFRGHAIRMIEQAELSTLDYAIARSKVGSHVKKYLEEFHRNNTNNYAILSLSKVPNNLLMWAHYCDSHRGFVLGFDSTHRFFQTREFKRFSTLAEVHYSNERPVMPAPVEWDGSQEQIEKALSSEDWEYEQELRMIANPKIADRRVDGVDGHNIYLFKLPDECLSEVIFGARMLSEERLQIARLAKNRYPHARLFSTALNQEKFDLDIVPLA